MLAHGRADAVGADQQVAALAGAVLEYRADTAAILFDPAQLLAEPVILCRQRRAKRAIEPRPGAHDPCARLLEDDVAGAIETNDLRHRDTHGRIEGDSGAAQHRNELRMGAKPDAAAGQRFLVALEYYGVPAGAAKEIRRQ